MSGYLDPIVEENSGGEWVTWLYDGPTIGVYPTREAADVAAHVERARAELVLLGLTSEQIDSVTGFGHRRIAGCLPDDTILNKYAAGALSARGVLVALYGPGAGERMP